MTPEDQLKVISRAWGRQSGYAFFPWISGQATTKEQRIKSFHEGRAFLWPKEKVAILEHMRSREGDDLYWCPSLFERKRRQMEFAMDEHALWADLDPVDPSAIKDYPPTIAWETSPGHYQALWLISGGDMQGASWMGRENQRLTYYLGADIGGWDTTQLLRIPGWKNHKPEHRGGTKEGPNEELKPPPKGKLLWANGRRYLPDDFEDLPEVQSMGEVQDVIIDEVERVDRHEVYARVRLKISKEVRDLLGAREPSGDRSEKLWQIERDLADAGCTVTEIVAITRASVWNKYEGRADEIKRLTIEASKAIAARSEETEAAIEVERAPKPSPTRLFALLKDVRPPQWLIKDIWAEGSCGFIAGQPKVYKSWNGLDMALSVATGIPYLDHFPVINPGPVLYIQEEDPAATVKARVEKIYPSKLSDHMKVEKGQVVWLPPTPIDDRSGEGPEVMAYIGEGFTVSDGGWQSWLDETLARGFDRSGSAVPYRLCIMDPLMMIAGDVEENRAQEMTEKVFKPIKQLARKHNIAMIFVHHMRKGDPSRPQRGGQLMLGSVANHAWAEDSLYLRLGRGGEVIVERESKHTTSGSFRITRLRNKAWTPTIVDDRSSTEDDEEEVPGSPQVVRNSTTERRPPRRASKLSAALEELGAGPHSTSVLAAQMGVSPSGAYKQLARAQATGKVKKTGNGKWEAT